MQQSAGNGAKLLSTQKQLNACTSAQIVLWETIEKFSVKLCRMRTEKHAVIAIIHSIFTHNTSSKYNQQQHYLMQKLRAIIKLIVKICNFRQKACKMQTSPWLYILNADCTKPSCTKINSLLCKSASLHEKKLEYTVRQASQTGGFVNASYTMATLYQSACEKLCTFNS